MALSSYANIIGNYCLISVTEMLDINWNGLVSRIITTVFVISVLAKRFPIFAIVYLFYRL